MEVIAKVELSRSLIKEFAKATGTDDSTKPKSNWVRGTVKMVGDKKFVQLDGSDVLTPLTETVDVQANDRVLVSIENHTATVLGNFTFVPSARKEQEAINKANSAQSTASNAQSTANNAQDAANESYNKAQEASDKADSAIEMAGEASQHAEDAKQSASEAITASNNASQNASEAKEAASAAASAAETARQEAEESQQASANAQAEVARINGEVTAVKGDINSALDELADQAAETEAIRETLEIDYAKKTDVSSVEASLTTEISKRVGELQTTVEENYAGKNEVVDLEGRLQSQITQNAEGLTSTVSKVEKLESDTTVAQQHVSEALSKANEAQEAAQLAQANATASQAAADAAKADANIAADKATAAHEAAQLAESVANAADQKVQEAQSDLDEARENLTNVTNRVGATEEEIAAAQARVDQAQTAVNQALADAAEANVAANKAQDAADKAQSDAEQAQIDATTAQQKADSASLAASEAQKAADKANADVAALTKRVTLAETKIEQNSEAITLTATKIEEIGNRKSITETTVYWYLSESSTELIGGEWVEGTAPAWEDGSYYWQKVLTKYFDGSTKESTPVCLTGPSGQNGATGKGIKSTAVTYQASTSGTSVPTGTWSTTIPTVSANQYLWTRTTITYTDDTTSVSYSIGKIGATGGTGPSGADGKGVKTTTITYQGSTSGTIVPTGTWSSTIPSVAAGSYLWTRTVITYTDNTTSTSYSIGKMGDTGPQGAQGIQGLQGPEGKQGVPGPQGATGKTSYFHIKYSSVANPTTSSQISETPNTYIGTYVDFTETDSTDPTKYTWSRFVGAQGEKGDQGIAGTNGANGKTSYLHIAYATNSTGTSGFSVSDSANKTYIGQYTDFTSADSTDPTKYNWTKIQGPTGATGQGISSITVQYYLSTSKTTQTGGSWTTTMPTWKTGTYLWIRNKIVYENPTSTAYTTPYCDSSWEAAKDVADDLKNNYYSKTQTDAKLQVQSDEISLMATKTEEIDKRLGNLKVGGRNLILNSSIPNRNRGTNEYPCGQYDLSEPVVAGEKYTWQMCATFTNAHRAQMYFGGASYSAGSFISINGDGKKTIGGTFTANANQASKDYVYFYVRGTEDPDSASASNAKTVIHWVKLEKGTMATDWTPAPEDTEAGGRNLILKSDQQIYSAYQGTTMTVTSNVTVDEWNATDAYTLSGTGGTSAIIATAPRTGVVYNPSKRNMPYMVSVYVKNNHASENFYVSSNIPSLSGKKTRVDPGQSTRVVIPASGNGTSYVQINLSTETAGAPFNVTLWHPQIEEGTVVSAWKPAQEDTEIGSKNLIKPTFSSKSTNATKAGNYGIQWDMSGESTADTFFYINPYEPLTVNEWYTLSFTVSGKQGTDEIPFGIEGTSSGFKIGIVKNGRVSATFQYKNIKGDTSRLIIDNIGSIPASQTTPLVLSKIQLEKGTVATDFAPAPEVVEENLANNYYTKTQTDAKLKVESDRITSTVSRVEIVESTANSANSYVNSVKNNWGYQYKYDITINGDVNMYYPVVFGGGNQQLVRDLFVQRSYLEKAPTEWDGHPSAKGIGLTLLIKCNFGGWGGIEYNWDIYNLNQMYGELVAGVGLIMNGMGFYIFLRGGGSTGALYHICSDQPLQVSYMNGTFPKVCYNSDQIGNSGETVWNAPHPVELTDARREALKNKIFVQVANDAKEGAKNAQATADDAMSTADSTESRVAITESAIEQLSDAISMLVTDENGNSMMTQTSDGWHFDISDITNTLDSAKNQLNALVGDMAEAESLIKNVNDLANDIADKTAYINITTVNSQPAIVLGQSSNNFKLRITNTSIDFLSGSSRLAYISNENLYIERAIIKDEFQIGEGSSGAFIWKRRSNGNLGLRWVSG